jgi:hypothetical protein
VRSTSRARSALSRVRRSRATRATAANPEAGGLPAKASHWSAPSGGQGRFSRDSYPSVMSRILRNLCKPSRLAPLCLAAGVAALTSATPACAVAWNFSFQLHNGDTASGAMTTSGTSAVAGQTYSITAFSATFKGQSITRLQPGPGWPTTFNQFEWTGAAHHLRYRMVLDREHLAGQQRFITATPSLLALLTPRTG